MNKKTLEALKGSIKKWEKIVARTGLDEGGVNCPLCEKFRHNDNFCVGCPVARETGSVVCNGSPHEEWCTHQIGTHYDNEGEFMVFKNCPDCKTLAQAELDFLKSLLPKATS